jgi:REP element-mobilizing transposase RayT
LWLRTAQKGRKLTTLNNNIKCGNSLIDDPAVAGEKAFNWQQEFPGVFVEKEKQPYHITWVTHNARVSKRMIAHKVQRGDAFWMEDEHEAVVAKTIKETIEQDDLCVMAYNSCGDHVHILLVCEEEEIPNIVRKLKGKSSQRLKEHLQIPKEEQFTLWAQKYSKTYINSTEQLWNTVAYIQNNRTKHGLPINKGLQPHVDSTAMQMDYNHAFRTQYKGGFDVVIGNPPYGAYVSELEKDYYRTTYEVAEYNFDTYNFFFEKSVKLVNLNRYVGFITPNTFLVVENGERLRKFLFERNRLIELFETFNVFPDAVVEPINIIIKKCRPTFEDRFKVTTRSRNGHEVSVQMFEHRQIYEGEKLVFNYRETESERILFDKIKSASEPLKKYAKITTGIKPYQQGKGSPKQTIAIVKNKPFTGFEKKEGWYPLVRGTQINRYLVKWDGEFIQYGEWLAEPRTPEIFFKPKLLIRRTDDTLMCAYDGDSFIGINSVHCIQSMKNGVFDKYLLSIINSKLCNWYFRHQNFHMVGKPLAEVKVVFVERLPIRLANAQQKYIDHVNIIMIKTSEFHNLLNQFTLLLQSKFALLPLSTKLQNWHELTFSDFLKELKKAKVQLSLSEEAEWIQYFNEQKQKAQTLKTEIDRVDAAIDKMVYELYGLTEEEIRVVEGGS